MPRLGVRMGRGVKVGMGMCMQANLWPLQACLTVKIYGASSLPAAFPGSSSCFQDCKDDSGKWHSVSFLPALALPRVRFSSALPSPPSCLFLMSCRAS